MVRTSSKPSFRDRKVTLVENFLYQVVANGSEYNQKTFYPIIASVSLLLQKPFVLPMYGRPLSSKNPPELLSSSIVYGLSHHSSQQKKLIKLLHGFFSNCDAEEKIDEFGIKLTSSNKNYLIVLDRNGEEVKYEIYFVIFDILSYVETDMIEYEPVGRNSKNSEDVEVLELLIDRISSGGVFGERALKWFSQTIKEWRQLRSFINNQRQISNDILRKADRQTCAALAEENNFSSSNYEIVFDVFSELLQRLRKSSLVSHTGTDQNGPANLFLFIQHFSNEARAVRWIMPSRQMREIANHLDPDGGKISERLLRGIGTDLKKLSPLLDASFASGNPVFAIDGGDRSISEDCEEGQSAGLIFSCVNKFEKFRLSFLPVWLSGAPYAVVVVVSPRHENIEEDWLFNYLMYTEVFLSGLYRRFRARIRWRFAELIYNTARETFGTLFDLQSTEGKTSVSIAVDRFNQHIEHLSRVYPFDRFFLEVASIDEEPLSDSDWIGQIDEYNVFVRVEPNIYFPRWFPAGKEGSSSSDVYRRARNALRRALRDNRVRFAEQAYSAIPKSTAHHAIKDIADKLYLTARRKNIIRDSILLILEYDYGSTHRPLLGALAYAIHLKFDGGAERIRAFSPGLCASERKRFDEKVALIAAGVPHDAAQSYIQRHADSLIFFSDFLQTNTLLSQKVASRIADLHLDFRNKMRIIVVSDRSFSGRLIQVISDDKRIICANIDLAMTSMYDSPLLTPKSGIQ